MEKITATVYDTIDPYQWVTDVAHDASIDQSNR